MESVSSAGGLSDGHVRSVYHAAFLGTEERQPCADGMEREHGGDRLPGNSYFKECED